MEGIGLVRLLGQRRLVDPGRPIQIAPFVVGQGLAQVHGHRSDSPRKSVGTSRELRFIARPVCHPTLRGYCGKPNGLAPRF